MNCNLERGSSGVIWSVHLSSVCTATTRNIKTQLTFPFHFLRHFFLSFITLQLASTITQLSPEAYWYVGGSAGSGETERSNKSAFKDYRIVRLFLFTSFLHSLSLFTFYSTLDKHVQETLILMTILYLIS